MKAIKKSLLFSIGVAVLLLVICIFFFAQRSNDLETGNMKNWLAASSDRRAAAVKILTASDEHNDLLIACVDKIASLPDSGEMAIRDAVSLCYTGIQLKDSI